MTGTFQDDWGFAEDVKATIEGAVYYDVRPTPENFKTGRAKFECLFLDASKNRVIERRPAMELISKRTGQPLSDFWRITGDVGGKKLSLWARASQLELI